MNDNIYISLDNNGKMQREYELTLFFTSEKELEECVKYLSKKYGKKLVQGG